MPRYWIIVKSLAATLRRQSDSMKKSCIFCEKELDTQDFDCIRLPGDKFLYYSCLECLEKNGGYDASVEKIKGQKLRDEG